MSRTTNASSPASALRTPRASTKRKSPLVASGTLLFSSVGIVDIGGATALKPGVIERLGSYSSSARAGRKVGGPRRLESRSLMVADEADAGPLSPLPAVREPLYGWCREEEEEDASRGC